MYYGLWFVILTVANFGINHLGFLPSVGYAALCCALAFAAICIVFPSVFRVLLSGQVGRFGQFFGIALTWILPGMFHWLILIA